MRSDLTVGLPYFHHVKGGQHFEVITWAILDSSFKQKHFKVNYAIIISLPNLVKKTYFIVFFHLKTLFLFEVFHSKAILACFGQDLNFGPDFFGVS